MGGLGGRAELAPRAASCLEQQGLQLWSGVASGPPGLFPWRLQGLRPGARSAGCPGALPTGGLSVLLRLSFSLSSHPCLSPSPASLFISPATHAPPVSCASEARASLEGLAGAEGPPWPSPAEGSCPGPAPLQSRGPWIGSPRRLRWSPL